MDLSGEYISGLAAFQVADFTNWDQIKSIGYSALISAAAAGLSAVWNFVLGILPEEKSEQHI